MEKELTHMIAVFRRARHPRILLAAAALVLLLSACGGTSSSSTGAPSTSATSGSNPTATTSQSQSQSHSAGKGGARIDKPFQAQITGAQCVYVPSSHPGFAGFLFPPDAPNPTSATLGFTLGPNPQVGQDAAHNPPYTGPGHYAHIILAGSTPDGKQSFGDFGTVIINADKQTGTFVTDDGTASGSFDCGFPLVS
jgi:hypothetical protein